MSSTVSGTDTQQKSQQRAHVSQLKVAIVCDWLTGIGGAERVVLELHHLFPNAPIYTSQYDSTRLNWFKDADVRTTWLQKLPKQLKKFLPVLRAWSFSRLDLRDYDLVISSSGAEAKGIKTSEKTIHACYMHAPTHYYWSRYEAYLQEPGFGHFNWLARAGLKLLVGPMRRWDKQAANRPDYIIANSTHTQEQIKHYYGRDAVVIHPPVEIERFNSVGSERRGFVTAGRQVPYKKIDLAVAACTKLSLPLTVLGNGPEHAKLTAIAGPTITFITDADDQQIGRYFQTALAFIFPGVDDFGIVAVESLAAGTPVIAYKAGGALDYVREGQTGIFFISQTIDSLADKLVSFAGNSFDSKQIRNFAKTFSAENFKQQMLTFIESIIL